MPIFSYGIACCKRNTNGQYEILMIKKRCTYSYSEFIKGCYDITRKQDLINLFDNMTIDEKLAIKTHSFEAMWFKNYGSLPSKDRSSYNKLMRKFNSLLAIKNGEYLNEIIDSSKNAELLWEIPKGRQDKKESPIETAIREFYEETNISKDRYRILFEEGTITYSFIDNGVKYVYIYYIAIICNNRSSPKFSYTSIHMPREVGNIKFLSINNIRMLNNNRLYKICKIIIKKAKKHIQHF